MAKKINFGTITNDYLKAFSDYNVALHRLDELAIAHKKALTKLNEDRDDIIAKRAEYMEKNPDTTAQELDSKYNLPKALRDIIAENNKYQSDCKPYKDDKKTFMDTYIKDLGFYAAYKAYLATGNSATLKDCYKSFFKTIGALNADNDTALDNTIRRMGGMIGVKAVNKTNKNGDWVYIKEFSESQYNNTFVSLFLHFLVNVLGVVTVGIDYTLSMTIYEDDFEGSEEVPVTK